MIKSMTGYGQGRAAGQDGMFTVQIQSVNRKYLDIAINLDREFLELENPVRSRVSQWIHRGKILVFIQHEAPAEQHSRVVLNKRLAKEYLHAFHDLQREFRLAGHVELSDVLAAKDVVQVLETHPDKQRSMPLLFKALDFALRQFDQMRIREGRNLERDFRLRLGKFSGHLAAIRRQIPITLRNYQHKLRKRSQESQGQDAQERQDRGIASFAEKVDCTEEIVRFDSHIRQFYGMLGQREPKGKALDFLMQEMFREVNTIGAKANDLVISKRIIAIKADLEKIREQVQNVE